ACYVAAIWPGASRLAWLRRHDVVSFAVPALLLIMLVAAFILRGMLVPPGYFRVAEFALHYLTPPIFLIWWAVFLADGTLKFSAIPPWLFPPAIYLGLVFMRGAVVAVYPYPFFNVAEAGIGRVLTWLAAMLVVFVACCVLTVLADRWLARLKAARTALP
ncbi:MAG: Pr6Pr family membrane protein, partial [Cucumibacter sp.]